MSLQIIDCTLRDGSNAIDFRFDEKLTRRILTDLDRSGIEWIDMGHGLGLGASERSGNKASLTDDEYISLAKEILKNAKCGFFFLKKFGTKDDIRDAKMKGIDFIRIGSNITEVSEVREYIEYAKDLGLWVNICLMKSYAVDVDVYQGIINELGQWNLDLITLMDSAGYFIPEQVEEYIVKGRLNTDIPIGLHTHNNMQLAVVNAVAAIKAGAGEIDCSVGGLGRSSGNAPTEIIALILQRYGYKSKLDYKILTELSDEIIYPLISGENRFSTSALLCGYGGFHSSFLPLVKEKSGEAQKDYRDVILKLCEKTKVTVTDSLLKEVLSEL